jgi:hypothetical protein
MRLLQQAAQQTRLKAEKQLPGWRLCGYCSADMRDTAARRNDERFLEAL